MINIDRIRNMYQIGKGTIAHYGEKWICNDVQFLLIEIDRLRAENKALKQKLVEYSAGQIAPIVIPREFFSKTIGVPLKEEQSE